MRISQLDPNQAERFGSSHAIHHGLADGRQVVLLSGVVNVGLQSPGWVNENTEARSFTDNLSIDLALPSSLLQAGQHFQMLEAVPYLSINAITGVSNVAWGVNSFALVMQQTALESVRLNAELSVSRTSEILQSVAYHITLIGQVVS